MKRETHSGLEVGIIADISIHSLVKRETERLAIDLTASEISIHSLVKRETPLAENIHIICEISIHSLVKRETSPIATPYGGSVFQSTPS